MFSFLNIEHLGFESIDVLTCGRNSRRTSLVHNLHRTERINQSINDRLRFYTELLFPYFKLFFSLVEFFSITTKRHSRNRYYRFSVCMLKARDRGS